jgi:hypothetical protein
LIGTPDDRLDALIGTPDDRLDALIGTPDAPEAEAGTAQADPVIFDGEYTYTRTAGDSTASLTDALAIVGPQTRNQ